VHLEGKILTRADANTALAERHHWQELIFLMISGTWLGMEIHRAVA
jgi:hypothetical protein